MILSRKLLIRSRELKQDVPYCLLLAQVGAFMQVIDQDARTVSQVTGLKLQMAGEVDDPVVVGGFPRSGLDAYVGTWVRAGHLAAVVVPDANNERRLAEVIRVCGGGPAGALHPPQPKTGLQVAAFLRTACEAWSRFHRPGSSGNLLTRISAIGSKCRGFVVTTSNPFVQAVAAMRASAK